MKLVSWNVNGLRAVMKKNFLSIFENFEADFFCLQEIKLQEGQIEMPLPDYHHYWNYAEKKATQVLPFSLKSRHYLFNTD